MHGAVHGGPLWSMHGAVHGAQTFQPVLLLPQDRFEWSDLFADLLLYQLPPISVVINKHNFEQLLHLMLSGPQRTVLGVSPVFLLLTALK